MPKQIHEAHHETCGDGDESLIVVEKVRQAQNDWADRGLEIGVLRPTVGQETRQKNDDGTSEETKEKGFAEPLVSSAAGTAIQLVQKLARRNETQQSVVLNLKVENGFKFPQNNASHLNK